MLALSDVTVDCGATPVYGPASVSVNDGYGAGTTLALTASCATGSQVSVTFTPSASSSALGTATEVVFDLLPSSGTSATAVAAADATSFTAGTPVSALPFTTPTYAAATYLYVYLTELEPQGD